MDSTQTSSTDWETSRATDRIASGLGWPRKRCISCVWTDRGVFYIVHRLMKRSAQRSPNPDRLYLPAIGGAKRREIPISKSLLVSWMLFLSAGLFLSLMTPLGEGLDESWHFAYVQHVAQRHTVPLGNSKYVSKEIELFLRNHPGSRSLHSQFPVVQTYEDYWAQRTEDREAMDRTISDLRFNGTFQEAETPLAWQYESNQPPLYYALTAPVFSLISNWFSFANTFLLIRIWTVLLASLVVPAMWVLSGFVFDQRGLREAAVLLVVVFPGLYPGVIRVANDALTAALACWLFAALVAYLKTERRSYLFAAAGFMVAGLWSKAFYIPILGGTVLGLLSFRKVRPALLILAASALGAPWYVINYRFSGSLTGLSETVIEKVTLSMSLQSLWMLDWENLAKVLRSSHIWIGNWSLLGVRSWWYQVISWIFLLALLGFIRKPGRLIDRTIRPLLVIYLGMLTALVYYATQVFVHKGISVAEGWYLASFIPIEAVLVVAGAHALMTVRARWLLALLAICCLGLSVYCGAFVAFPYYAGITQHNPSGSLMTFHPSISDFPLMASRLLRHHPAIPDILPWLLLLNFATIGIYRILKPTPQ